MDRSFKSIPRFETIFFSPIAMKSTTLLMASNRNALIFYLSFIFCDCTCYSHCLENPSLRQSHSLLIHFLQVSAHVASLLRYFLDYLLCNSNLTLHTAQPVFCSFIAININIFIVIDININVYALLMNFIFQYHSKIECKVQRIPINLLPRSPQPSPLLTSQTRMVHLLKTVNLHCHAIII